MGCAMRVKRLGKTEFRTLNFERRMGIVAGWNIKDTTRQGANKDFEQERTERTEKNPRETA